MDAVVQKTLEAEHRLKLVQRIGRGGFAEVWQAQSSEGVPCALKVSLDPLDNQNPAIQKELENLQMLKALCGHPHVVTLMDVWTINGYLVTRWEFSGEGSLEKRLSDCQAQGQRGIPVKELLRYIYDAAQGIDFLNKQGIVHRDIKPANLLLFFGRVKVADLGLAKFVGASTASHTAGGTFGYLPPEAWAEGRLTASVDLYALAATYVKLRTGQEPFGSNPVEILERQKRNQPVVDGLAPAEKHWVWLALAPRAEYRPQQSSVAWVRQLEAALGVAGTFTPKQPLPPQSAAQGQTAAPVKAVLAPSENRRLIRVKIDGTGDANSLEEAVRLVRPGGVIKLEPRTYQLERPLELTGTVTLLGAGMDKTRLVATGEGFVLLLAGTGRCEVRDIAVEHAGTQWANVLEIACENALIERCRFSGGKRDAGDQRGGAGLCIYGQSRALVLECVAEYNQLAGIYVSDQAQPSLERNVCWNNKGSGIIYDGNSGGVARGNTCERNKVYGIQVSKQAQPTLENNACRSNERCGIAYFGNSGGVARGNTCERNQQYGIWVSSEAKPTLADNLCQNNAAGQVQVHSVLGCVILILCGIFGAIIWAIIRAIF